MEAKILYTVFVVLVVAGVQGIPLSNVEIAGKKTSGDEKELPRIYITSENEETAAEQIYKINSQVQGASEDIKNTDEVLTEEQKRLFVENGNGRSRRSIKKDSAWKNGIVPYTFEDTYNAGEKNKIKKAMEIIESVSCVKFIPRTSEKNFVHIYQGGVCSSNVGEKGGEQYLSLQAPSCLTEGVAVHELLHTLGFYHEQSRIDRDTYIEIVWSRVRQNKEHNFNKRSAAEVYGNGFGFGYDYKSIMHYGSNFWSINGLPTIVNKKTPNDRTFGGKKMTDIDKAQLKALYNCDNQKRSAAVPTQTTTTTSTTTTTPATTTTTESTCQDNDGTCPSVGALKLCHQFDYDIKCPKTCGLCSDDSGIQRAKPTTTAAPPPTSTTTTKATKPPPPTTTTTTTTKIPTTSTATPPTTQSAINEDCVDRVLQCSYVKQYDGNVCEHHYFRTNCQRACGFCSPPTITSSTTKAPCVNSRLALCAVVSGQTDLFCNTQSWARTLCRKTCNTC